MKNISDRQLRADSHCGAGGEDDRTIAEYTVDYKKTHSQTLLPMISEMMEMVEMDIASVDAIAVSGGPGSFTGLRIGSATAKGLGLALNKPLVHVPTVDALAYSVYGCQDIICPIMDARRNQVYTGVYTFAPKDSGTEENPVRGICFPGSEDADGSAGERSDPEAE